MSALGTNGHPSLQRMAAIEGEADMPFCTAYVCFCAKADIALVNSRMNSGRAKKSRRHQYEGECVIHSHRRYLFCDFCGSDAYLCLYV
jgi:hypothetical protein